jgi:hypothetical protein
MLKSNREEEAKARRLARFGAELSQPVVELVEMPVSRAEPSKQQDDIDFSEATAIVGLCPDMCPGLLIYILHFLGFFLLLIRVSDFRVRMGH